VGKSLGIHPFGRMRQRWEDNIKMDFREIGCDHGRWTELSQDCVPRQFMVLGLETSSSAITLLISIWYNCWWCL